MFTKRSTTGRLKRIVLIVLLLAVIAGSAYGMYVWLGSRSFGESYRAYSEAQKAYITAANKPAAEANPVRKQVYQLLAEVLQLEMSNEARIEKAKQGIAHLNDLERQIDSIKDEADVVIPLLAQLEESSAGIVGSSKKELVQLGNRQVAIISDIRGLSYRADFYTSEVFERIIDEQGAMSDEHKTYLNEMIPQLEEQFDKRANLYAELKENDDQMKGIARELGYATE